jgi:hypothetical protein
MKSSHSKIVQEIYDGLTKKFGYKPLCAKHKAHDNPECAEEYGEQIPLHVIKIGGRKSKLAEVDMVVPFKEAAEKIKYIIEVEESFPPKTIVGDVVACQLSKFCKLKGYKELVPIENSKLLIVVDSQKIKVEESCKKDQFGIIKRRLNEVMREGSLNNYFLIYSDEFEDEFRKIDGCGDDPMGDF